MESFVTSLRLAAATLLVCVGGAFACRGFFTAGRIVGVLEPNLAPDRQ